MSFASEPIFQWLAQYAYEPMMVYMLIFCMMMASGFGFPLPEEVTIISVGILSFMGSQPHLFPPPYEGAPHINGIHAAVITTVSVFFADALVFHIGRLAGRKVVKRQPFARFFTDSVMEKVNGFIKKFGLFAAFVFRFTPGIRFPGHVLLGMSTMPVWKFFLVDFFACIISIPTQILLLYKFGEPILLAIQKFKVWILFAFCIAAIFLIVQKLWAIKKSRMA